MSNTLNTSGTSRTSLLFPGISLLYGMGLVYIAYFLDRADTLPLLLSFGALLALCLYAYKQAEQVSITQWFIVAVLLRLLLLPAIPSLSDDFYRFIWDGRLLLAGEHPFAHIPSWYMQAQAPSVPGITRELYQQLNSPEYHTIYPPLHQATFYLAALVGQENILANLVVLRTPIILAETGTLWLILKLLQHYKMPKKRFLLYALNPLVILECTANLHFEALMVFFLLLGTYLLNRFFKQQRKSFLIISATAFACAIASKLLPLMFIPFWFRKLAFRPFLTFLLGGIAFCLLLFLPLYNAIFLRGLQNSLSLYYQKFEFNASLYYLFREAGYWFTGYNIIGTAGPLMALLALSCILLFSLGCKARRISLPAGMLWAYAIFLLFSLTVHPWYIIPLLAFSLFTRYRFPVLWSGLIFLTYAGYGESGFEESNLILIMEYSCVVLFFLWEWRRNNLHKTEQKSYAKRLAG
jgi:alpha-1,6-mannosyltransferase